MTLVQYLFDAGPQDGPVTNANGGSVAASLTNGATTTYDSVAAAQGAFGMRVAIVAVGGQAFRRWQFQDGVGATNYAVSLVFTMPASAPSGTLHIANFANASDAPRLSLYITTTGSIQFADLGTAHTVTAFTGLSWGAKYRISLVVAGGSTTAGQVQAKLYSGTTSWTTQVGSTVTRTDLNLGTDQVSRFDVGIINGTAPVTSIGIDSLQLDNGRTTEIPDYVVPEPPVVSNNELVYTTTGWR